LRTRQLPFDLTGFEEVVRYEIEGRHGPVVFHGKKHLDRLHEERMDMALAFDLEEHMEETTQTYLTPPIAADTAGKGIVTPAAAPQKKQQQDDVTETAVTGTWNLNLRTSAPVV
jgi:hypothetical protein